MLKLNLSVFFLPILLFLASTSADCQEEKIGYVDVYGFVSKELITGCIPSGEGGNITVKDVSALKQQLKDCLLSLPGVQNADITIVCCDNTGRTIIYAGTSERKMEMNSSREKQDIQLPIEMLQSYDSLLYHVGAGVRSGGAGEDLSRGYSLLNYQPARQVQESFINAANQNLDLLINVLRNSKYNQHRIVAAYILPYADKRSVVVSELIAATRNEHDEVRNNAIRAIAVLADYSVSHPNPGYSIPFEPFVSLMNSIHWTDRNKASMVLLSLSQTNRHVLQELKEKALKPLIDMATWKNEGHAFPAIILLGRMAGWGDDRIIKMHMEDKDLMLEKLISELSKQQQ